MKKIHKAYRCMKCLRSQWSTMNGEDLAALCTDGEWCWFESSPDEVVEVSNGQEKS